MSIAGYLGKPAGELRLAEGDVAAEKVEGAVLEGKLAVEEAVKVMPAQRSLTALCGLAEARKAWKPGERYESVADYDPVLRSHCRLDKEG